MTSSGRGLSKPSSGRYAAHPRAAGSGGGGAAGNGSMEKQASYDLDFLAANIHGRRSRLAEADRLDELVRLRGLPDLARALFPEGKFLSPARLQKVLVLDHIEEISDLAGRIGGSSGRFLDWLRLRFRMENVKVLARGLTSGLPLEALRPHLVPLPDDLAVPAEALASAGTVEAFVAVLPEGPLRDGAELGIDLFNARPRPFFIEAGLDHGYLAELLRRARALPRASRDDVLEIARQEADTFHLMMAARGKFHFELKPAAITKFHVEGAGLARPEFARMAGAEGLVEVGRIAVGLAVDSLPQDEKIVTAATLEALAWNRHYRLANRTFRRSHMGLGAIVAYAAIKRVELANLIRLIEGIRMGFDPRQIRRRLIPRTDVES